MKKPPLNFNCEIVRVFGLFDPTELFDSLRDIAGHAPISRALRNCSNLDLDAPAPAEPESRESYLRNCSNMIDLDGVTPLTNRTHPTCETARAVVPSFQQPRRM